MNKVVAIITSNKYYVLNFYECVLEVYYPGKHTLIYCNPHEKFSEELIGRILDAPTKLVALVPDPDAPLLAYSKVLSRNVRKLNNRCFCAHNACTIAWEDEEENLEQEKIMNSLLVELKLIQDMLEAKVIFKDGITKKKDDEDEEEDEEMEEDK